MEKKPWLVSDKHVKLSSLCSHKGKRPKLFILNGRSEGRFAVGILSSVKGGSPVVKKPSADYW